MIDTDRINARSEDERTNWVQRAFSCATSLNTMKA